MWFYILLLVVFVVFIFFWMHGPQRYAAWFLSRFEQYYTNSTVNLKEAHFQRLNDIKSTDEDRKVEGIVKVLEIGCGPGANFRFYPKNMVITTQDPNPYFENYFKENYQKFPDTKIERSIGGFAENLKDVSDESMDLVVSTLVLCSVDDVEKVLQEVKRTLAPGGKFVFWEHVAATPGTWLAFWQNLAMYSRIWPFLADHCQLHRNIGKMIEDAGFSKVDCKSFHIPTDLCRPLTILSPHVKGMATK